MPKWWKKSQNFDRWRLKERADGLWAEFPPGQMFQYGGFEVVAGGWQWRRWRPVFHPTLVRVIKAEEDKA